MKKDSDRFQDNRSSRLLGDRQGSHSFTELLLDGDRSDLGSDSWMLSYDGEQSVVVYVV